MTEKLLLDCLKDLKCPDDKDTRNNIIDSLQFMVDNNSFNDKIGQLAFDKIQEFMIVTNKENIQATLEQKAIDAINKKIKEKLDNVKATFTLADDEDLDIHLDLTH